jgi:topoisomerase-4 subunit B
MNRRGTTVRFHPDVEIFGKSAHFKPARLMKMARSKAYLFAGVEIRWTCAPELLGGRQRRTRNVRSFPSPAVCRTIWPNRWAMSVA